MVAVPLAAAAALVIWTLRGGLASSDLKDPSDRVVAESGSGSAADSTFGVDEEVSDELLASLSVLENFDFLTEELEPLEADALFLLSADDQVLLDLLDAEAETTGEDD